MKLKFTIFSFVNKPSKSRGLIPKYKPSILFAAQVLIFHKPLIYSRLLFAEKIKNSNAIAML